MKRKWMFCGCSAWFLYKYMVLSCSPISRNSRNLGRKGVKWVSDLKDTCLKKPTFCCLAVACELGWVEEKQLGNMGRRGVTIDCIKVRPI